MMNLLCITIISLTLATCANSMATPLPGIIQMTAFVTADIGANVTLPCRHLSTNPDSAMSHVGIRVKWTKIADDESLNEDVLSSMGFHKKTFGSFDGRVSLIEEDQDDASLLMNEVSVEDSGKYLCEIMNGMHDDEIEVYLEVNGGPALPEGSPTLREIQTQASSASTPLALSGVVFPYSLGIGRYNLNFDDAVQTCADQGSAVATFDQLFDAWKGGLDWCNAGWLSDGTVQYPITKPRINCGGANNAPGVRSYGRRNRMSLYDVFCFASALKGHFYWLVQPDRLTFDEAVQACVDDGAEIAKVGHMYGAWKLENYDRCDAGWLADGSVRYPISRPRKNCSPVEAAVRFVSFPDKLQKSYGVYCFKADE